MKFDPPLVPAHLDRRYKRFLADVTLESGEQVTAHVANPGKMTGLAGPGSRIWMQHSSDPKRKLAWSWKLTELETGLVGVDTGAANRLVEEALLAHRIPSLKYPEVRREVAYGDASRTDFLLTGDGEAWVEVKSVTLSRAAGLAEFPDTKTVRGARHLRELAKLAQTGRRAVLFYLVQRTDCDSLSVAQDIDPDYAKAYRAARSAGVEVLAYRVSATPQAITLSEVVDVVD